MKYRSIILVILVVLLIVGLFAFVKAFGKKDSSIKEMFKQEKYTEYKSGDIVSFNKQDWYVLHDSSSKDNYVTLIYKGILYLEENGIKVFSPRSDMFFEREEIQLILVCC